MAVGTVQAALGSSRSGSSGKAARSADRGDLLVGREDAALQLEGGEAVALHHGAGLGDDALGVERLAPGVGFTARVGGPLVEEVAAERDGLAHRAAEQVGHRAAEQFALDVQTGDLERGEHTVDGAAAGDHAGQSVAVAARNPGQRLLGGGEQGVQGEDVLAGQGACGGLQPGQVGRVGVGLAEPGDTGVGLHLDDGAQGEGLVHAHRVEQRGIVEGDRGDGDRGDPCAGAGGECGDCGDCGAGGDCGASGECGAGGAAHAALQVGWSSAVRARPASRMIRSRSTCSGVGSISGARTPPTSRPRIRTAALTSETA